MITTTTCSVTNFSTAEITRNNQYEQTAELPPQMNYRQLEKLIIIIEIALSLLPSASYSLLVLEDILKLRVMDNMAAGVVTKLVPCGYDILY